MQAHGEIVRSGVVKPIDQMRRKYHRGLLEREALDPNPIVQFGRWFDEACEHVQDAEPNAMALATVGPDGTPGARTVLLKYFDATGFVFFTNLESRKAQHIEANPAVALLFWWKELERQVEITGVAERISNTEAAKYFMTRPRGSQLGAPRRSSGSTRPIVSNRRSTSWANSSGSPAISPENRVSARIS